MWLQKLGFYIPNYTSLPSFIICIIYVLVQGKPLWYEGIAPETGRHSAKQLHRVFVSGIPRIGWWIVISRLEFLRIKLEHQSWWPRHPMILNSPSQNVNDSARGSVSRHDHSAMAVLICFYMVLTCRMRLISLRNQSAWCQAAVS